MIYIVQSGDTLSQICETLFKDSMEMYALAELNGIKKHRYYSSRTSFTTA